MAAHGALSAKANIAAATTDGAVVAAKTGQKINVLAVYAVTGGTATDVTFTTKPAGAGTAISALMATAINGAVVLPFNPKGWFTTNSGEGLSLTTGAGATVGVGVVYELVALP